MDERDSARLNLADWFLDARVRDGLGERTAIRSDDGATTYGEVQRLANRFGNMLLQAGVRPEERVIIGLPDSVDWVGAFFGALKIGAVVVMINPQVGAEALDYFVSYTRAFAAIVDAHGLAGLIARRRVATLVIDEDGFDARLAAASEQLDSFPSHRDDAAIWLFSGGTTGKPKAVVQSHASFVFTTRQYGQGVLGMRAEDITISVPKLFFGYATGSNLLFPFSVGASAVLFRERCTAEVLFAQIARHRPTVLINVPTMINNMLGDESAAERDLSCLRVATSAGEALPQALYARWKDTFGVELLDGLGTAEQWHVFISNRPGQARPGTLGQVVPGFDVRVRDEDGRDLPDGEIGHLWVRGGARAQGYWQRMERTMQAFRGEWYVSGDMVVRDADGYFTYCGRGDDMLKVSGKWLSPGEVENCLLEHSGVQEVAVIGVTIDGLVKPKAFVIAAPEHAPGDDLAAALKEHVRVTLEPYKYPREIEFLSDFPRTHLGKVDRGALKQRGATR